MLPNIKPKIIISKCLGFEACSWNGQLKKNDIISKLSEYVNFVTVCPEQSIGLSTPRNTIRLVKKLDKVLLIEPKSEKDLTSDMENFCTNYFQSQRDIDGFILKSRSPSCGTRDVKIYTNIHQGNVCKKGAGFFGQYILDNYAFLPREEDGRLTNFRIRENFFTKIFLTSLFRNLKHSCDFSVFMEFHNKNTLIYMLYNKKQLKILNQIVSEMNQTNFFHLLKIYNNEFLKLFTRMPRISSNVNVINHILNNYIYKLNSKEKEYFFSCVSDFENQRIPLSTLTYLLKSYVIRFNDLETLSQTFFEPFPKNLVSIFNSSNNLNE